MKPNLELSNEQWHALHADENQTRKSSKIVKVNRDALNCLLRDHSKVLAYAGIQE